LSFRKNRKFRIFNGLLDQANFQQKIASERDKLAGTRTGRNGLLAG